ncbi:MAG TPA: hypothetical protein VGF67_13750 [Ktedonobacteraceae bacterium]|jgi:hypothetical protein
MARICPQCSQTNQDETTFCRFCGYRFPENGQATNDDATIRPASFGSPPPNDDPGLTPRSPEQPTPVAQPTPLVLTPPSHPPLPAQGAPVYAPPVAIPNPQPQAPFMAPQTPQSNYPMQIPYAQPYGAQMQTVSTGGSSLQRAFARRGTPVRHQSWLLDGRQLPPTQLRSTLLEQINRQNVPGVTPSFDRLREQGLAFEEREFVRVQYGFSATYVYMAPMGQNLYISRTSTVRQPLSTIREVVLGGLFVLLLLCLIFFIVIHPSSADLLAGTAGFADGVNTFFGYAFYGLLFFFFFWLLRSLVFLLTDGDFLALLRPNRLSDFTLDTLTSVEKVTDRAIRETLRQSGLNADELTPAAQSYAPQQPLHRF